MNFLITSTLVIIFAFANRARGSRLFDRSDSTTVGRLASTFIMAAATGLAAWAEGQGAARSAILALWAWASLFFWCIWAWDKYWSAAIGNPTDIAAPACRPVDRIMSGLPAMPLRMWGTVAMGLRQAYLMPFLAGIAILSGHPAHAAYAPATLLFGVIYLVAGYASKEHPIAAAEYSLGACLAFLTYMMIGAA